MRRLADLIDITLCAGILWVGLTALAWLTIELVAFGTDVSSTGIFAAVWTALGFGATL